MSTDLPSLPPAPTRRIRLGVLGPGGIWEGAHRPALRVLQAAGWPVKVALMYDRDPARLAAAVKVEPGARAAASADELLGAGLDGLLILLPSGPTAEAVIAACGRVPVILAEKPIADELAPIEACAVAARRAGTRVQVGFNRPHQALMPAFLAQCRAQGVRHVAVRFHRNQRAEAVFYDDVLGHPLSLLHHAFGALAIGHVQVDRRGPDELAHGALVLGRAGATSFAIDLRPAAGRMVEEYLAIGEKASTRLVFQFGHVAAEPAGLWRLQHMAVEPLHVAAPDADHVSLAGFTRQLAAFVGMIGDQRAAPSSSLADAIAIQVAIRSAVAAIAGRSGAATA